MLEIERYDSTIASTSVPMRLFASADQVPLDKTSAIVLHRPPHVDAWFHFIFTVPSTRMKDKKLEFCAYTQHDASSLAEC